VRCLGRWPEFLILNYMVLCISHVFKAHVFKDSLLQAICGLGEYSSTS
jgi:hypothetical protein